MDVDIDIDKSRFDSAKLFPDWVRASVLQDGKLTPHPCGVYVQDMAGDPLTGLACIPYDEAEDYGYLKVDFLNLTVYRHFESRAEIERLHELEPDWTLLQLPSNHEKLFQLARHGELLQKIKPHSILELADVMALIRPGKKAYLPIYLKNPNEARKVLYGVDDTGYAFKKSHALAYAYVVQLQLHLIEQGRI